MKNYFLFSLALVFLGFVSLAKLISPQDFQLVVCDVGQGDAILIQYLNKQVLVDGGPDQKVLECLGRYMPWFDRQIELVVISHFDSDHIGGLNDVFLNYTVNNLLMSKQIKQTDDFKRLDELIQIKKGIGMKVFSPENTLVLTLAEGLKFQPILAFSENILEDVDGESKKNKVSSNDGSIAIFLSFKNAKALLMADIEEVGEQAILKQNLLMDVNLIKVGHHGSKSSTTLPLLTATQPEIAVISVGKRNQYGHPSSEVIARLKKFNSLVFRTDLEGDLVFTSNGQIFLFQNKSDWLN